MPDTNTVTSYSDLQRFTNCKRAWYLGSYLGLRLANEPLDGPLPFGSRIHAALELEGKGVLPAVEAYQQLMTADLEKAQETGMITENLVKEARLGQVMLEGYQEWREQTGHDAKYETVGVESKLSDLLDVRLTRDPEEPPVQVLLRGKLDTRLRRKSDGAILVGDYKTSGDLSSLTIDQFRQSPQPRLYLLLERQQQAEGEWSHGYLITILRKVLRTKTANPPFYYALEVAVSPKNLMAAEQNIRAQVVEMVAVKELLDKGFRPESVAPFHVSWQCKTCPFRNPCFEWQDGNYKGAKDMLSELYVKGDPFERYQDEDDATGKGF